MNEWISQLEWWRFDHTPHADVAESWEVELTQISCAGVCLLGRFDVLLTAVSQYSRKEGVICCIMVRCVCVAIKSILGWKTWYHNIFRRKGECGRMIIALKGFFSVILDVTCKVN